MLARVQADGVQRDLKKQFPEREWEIHAMSTMGDKDQKTALHEFNSKALWTTELEELLEKGELDMVVHCLKGANTSLAPPLLRSSLTDSPQTCPPNCPRTWK